MEQDRKTLSIEQACALVGVSRRTIYNWMHSDPPKIEYKRTVGGSRRIYADTLYLEGNEQQYNKEV